MEENTQDDRRAKMLEKVKKLLAMGRDGRGNSTECDTAMRQANALMAQFGIEEAEVDFAKLDAGTMIFGEAVCGKDGRAPEPGVVYRSLPQYAGVLCIGVAAFCDSIVSRRDGPHGQIIVFRGEKQDVLFARWVFGVLAESIVNEQKASGWSRRGEANDFQVNAASVLSRRLSALAQERKEAYKVAQKQSGSRALVVVDRKAIEIAQRFGTQKVRTGKGTRLSGAGLAGRDAGARINIPAGRPIAGGAGNARLN